MRTVRLGDLIAPARVRRAGTGTYPVLSMTMHAGLIDQSLKFKKRIASEDLSDYKVIARGQLVVGFPIDEGVLDFQDSHDDAIVSPAYAVWDIRTADVDRRYLGLFLRSQRALSFYKAKLRGSTARRRSLPSEVFLSLEVPLPKLDEQRRIAAILDHADSIRTRRRQATKHLDELAQSIFVNSFRSETTRASLADLGVKFTSGKNVVGSELDAHPTNRVVKVSAISSGRFLPGEIKRMPRDYRPPEKHRISNGDILFGRASGSLELLGATAVVDQECSDLFLPDKVWRLEGPAPSRAIPDYILGVLRSPDFRAYVRHNASGAAGVRNISQATVLAYSAPSPPISHQKLYAQQVSGVASQSLRSQFDAVLLDQLFASLQARAFRGEL